MTVHITSEGVQATCNQPACAQPQVTCGGQGSTATSTTIRTITASQGKATVALHEYVYKGDFAGLREKMKQLETKDNQPTLIGALQSTDDKVRDPSSSVTPNVLVQAVTPLHAVACAGINDSTPLSVRWADGRAVPHHSGRSENPRWLGPPVPKSLQKVGSWAPGCVMQCIFA